MLPVPSNTDILVSGCYGLEIVTHWITGGFSLVAEFVHAEQFRTVKQKALSYPFRH